MFYSKQLFKKFLLGGTYSTAAGAAAGAVAIKPVEGEGEGEGAPCTMRDKMEAASKSEACQCKQCQLQAKLRPSDLPLYGTAEESSGRMKVVLQDPTALEHSIGVARKELWSLYGYYKDYEKKALEIVETGKAHSESTLSFLREEATTVHRAGAIGLGGLAGVIMGLRGGFFKRMIYGSTGAAAMAALCYPREAAEISDQSLQLAKYYFTVVYHFIYGVKPEGFQFLSSLPVSSDKPASKESAPNVADNSAEPTVGTEVSTPKLVQMNRDQSNPADKDMYSTRSK